MPKQQRAVVKHVKINRRMNIKNNNNKVALVRRVNKIKRKTNTRSEKKMKRLATARALTE